MKKIGALYTKQNNYCVSLLRKTEWAYYEILDERKVSNNKRFWKRVQPSLSEKFNVRERISFEWKWWNCENWKRNSWGFSHFFGNIVKNLNTSLYSDSDPIIENVNRILKAIVKYKEHSIILAIKTKCNRNGVFSFREVSFQYIETEIRLLKLNEASQYSDIPTKIIKGNSDIFSNFICESINNSIQSIFLLCLKKTDVTLLHKKCNESLKENYKPVSILPTLSKVFERSMFEQMSRFFILFQNISMALEKDLVLNVSLLRWLIQDY